MSLRYYVYLSETKIEMLFGQIPRAARDDLSAEFKINLGVVSSSVQGRGRSTMQSQVLATEKYLSSEGMVGTVDEPAEFFEGSMTMRWGPIEDSPAVLFVGSTDETIVGLGGSLQHVLGGTPQGGQLGYVSSTPFLIAALRRDVPSLAPTEADRANMEALTYRGRDEATLALSMVAHAHQWMRNPEQRLTFLAKRLLWSGNDSGLPRSGKDGRALLLGTPVYVAQVD